MMHEEEQTLKDALSSLEENIKLSKKIIADSNNEYERKKEMDTKEEIIQSELRKAQLSTQNNENELRYLRKHEENVVAIIHIKKKLGTINNKAKYILSSCTRNIGDFIYENRPLQFTNEKQDRKEKRNYQKEFEELAENMEQTIAKKQKSQTKLTISMRPLNITEYPETSKNTFLIDLPTSLLDKLIPKKLIDAINDFTPSHFKEAHDNLLFEMEKENSLEKGSVRKRTMTGSITSSILVLITTLTIGILLAVIISK